jgi:hypothetical protein
MEKKKIAAKGVFALITAVALLASVSAVTYAWFSSNRTVTTNVISGRTDNEEVRLLISSAGGEGFSGSDEAELVQINQTSLSNLQPVSTADLKSFAYCPNTENGMASAFLKVENESYYYHGRVYIRAEAEGVSGSRMALYLDSTDANGNAAVQSEGGDITNAARLGLTFDGENAVILRLSDGENGADQRARNTLINGAVLGDGQVLDFSSGTVKAAEDPSESIADFAITGSSQGGYTMPAQPIAYIELGRTYAVDVYFYLEGCDPDCSDSISYDEYDLSLAFFGVLE